MKELCDLLNTHRCVILVGKVKEEGEGVLPAAPIITHSPSSKIECKAQVLHQSEEDNLRRHLDKILEPAERESFSFRPSDKGKVLRNHVIKMGGITAIIVFAVIIYHSLVVEQRPLTLDNLITAGLAALIASVVEGLIIAREHAIS